MEIFSVDLNIVGTAYIVANNLEEANEQLQNELVNRWYELVADHDLVNDQIYREMVEQNVVMATISPAITITGPCNGCELEEIDFHD